MKDVYITKKEEAEDRRNAADKKEYDQKILALISDKKDNSLKEMSIDDLEKLLK